MSGPLAERLRPQTLDEIVGQKHLLQPKGIICRSVAHKKPLSLLFWGPPGCGKTTLAKAYAHDLGCDIFAISAVSTGVAEIKKIIDNIISQPLIYRKPLLFVDEIHRYNKAQQDLFLPYVEKGVFTLIGATTENPSFAINNALLSRLHVLTLHALDEAALEELLIRCEKTLGALPLESDARTLLIAMAGGDGRTLLNIVEQLQLGKMEKPLSKEELQEIVSKRVALFDKSGDQHYNLISALHKALRGSDPDAALYWFTRMVEGGEEMLFVARRLIRAASEDVGLADPQALSIAIAAKEAYQMLGSPEGELALAEAVVYIALAPKSNAIYTAYGAAKKSVSMTGHLPPPSIIINAPTTLMKQQGYGAGYLYDHDMPHAFSGQNYFPGGMEREKYYHPVQRGFEREMCKRQAFFEKLRQEKPE
jgi:putative ATPase